MAVYKPVNQDIYRADLNPADRNNMALEAGYTGYSDFLNNANKIQQGGGGTNAQIGQVVAPQAPQTQPGAPTVAPTITTQPTINLPELYKNITKSSGVGDVETKLLDQERAYNQAVSSINDNPFLSEASRVGRVRKLSTDFQNSTANSRNELATKKADIETQLGLQTKQFDIDSAQAKQAVEQYNSLLSSGALDSASAEDIANITRATGLSSTMIQSAINARKQANEKEAKTQVITYDDGSNTGYAVINTQTGDIIQKQTVAVSKPKATSTTETKNTNKAISAVVSVLSAPNKDKYVDWKEYLQALSKAMATGLDEETAQTIVLGQMKSLGMQPYKW